jgi:hypothetical protein
LQIFGASLIITGSFGDVTLFCANRSRVLAVLQLDGTAATTILKGVA